MVSDEIKTKVIDSDIYDKESLFNTINAELLSPLEIIKTSSELLLKGITGKLIPEQLDFINRISMQSKKAISFLSQLKDSAGFTLGFDLSFIEVDLASLLNEIILKYSKQNLNIKIELKVSDECNTYKTNGDTIRLEQVLSIILGYTCKNSNTNSTINIILEPFKGQRRRDIRRSFCKILINYLDGSSFKAKDINSSLEGIASKNSQNDLKPFDLKLAKYLATLHKGTIIFDEVKGVRSFSIILPIKEHVSKEKSFKGSSVVLVSDYSEDMNNLESNLANLNLKITKIEDVEKVIKYINDNEIHSIFYNFLSDKDFKEFIDLLNAQEKTRSIPLFVLTNQKDLSRLIKYERDFSDYLGKPVDEIELIMKLDKYLDVNEEINKGLKSLKNVLILEGNISERKKIKEILKDKCNLVLTKNGLEALYFIQRKEFDLAILDVSAPIIDGLELMVRLRNIKPDLPVYFSTLEHDEVYRRSATIFGVLKIIKKPFDKTDLKKIIEL